MPLKEAGCAARYCDAGGHVSLPVRVRAAAIGITTNSDARNAAKISAHDCNLPRGAGAVGGRGLDSQLQLPLAFKLQRWKTWSFLEGPARIRPALPTNQETTRIWVWKLAACLRRPPHTFSEVLCIRRRRRSTGRRRRKSRGGTLPSGTCCLLFV